MLAGGFREEGSGVPSGVAEAVERLNSNRERTSTRTLELESGRFREGSPEEAGILLELEDIARERCGGCVVTDPDGALVRLACLLLASLLVDMKPKGREVPSLMTQVILVPACTASPSRGRYSAAFMRCVRPSHL